MNNLESKLLYDIWEVVHEHIHARHRIDVGISIIRAFNDANIDTQMLAEATEDDPHLAAAYKAMAEDEPEYDRDEDDDY